MSYIGEAYRSFTPEQRRNIAIYILGIMFYKLGLEFFNGSISSMASDRFTATNTFTKLGAASGINQAAQCVGAILIAPLVQRFATRSVLSSAVVLFGIMTTILLITDAATGGHIGMVPKGTGKDLKMVPQYGSWNPNAIFPIWAIAGIGYGMVELIRRVIPADICGGDVMRLRRMDATVHILYEVAGTAGAFASSSAISRFGNNYSYFLTPVFFAFAAVIWSLIRPTPKAPHHKDAALSAVEDAPAHSTNYFKEIAWGAYLFFKSIYVGAILIFTHRVFLLANRVPTPIPWLRLDALLLNLVWVLPKYADLATAAGGHVKWAWYPALTFLPISYGWAAGDVSLAAYIQSTLNSMDINEPGISPLGAVMSFLYSSYIVMNAILSSVLGKVIDSDFAKNKNIHSSLSRVGGIQFSVCCGIILLSTLIPRGAIALNPQPTGDLLTPEDDEQIYDGAVLHHGGEPPLDDSEKASETDLKKPTPVTTPAAY
ncbi:hypothetical protein BKA62DRAFT_769556 [Auriculariales sp. MPI-PUGE-AT-0066]|nr:hypothetical protein BKA62DRAFT_769556 [Auriculariales sp. MPI-PUGE-AT-0066]